MHDLRYWLALRYIKDLDWSWLLNHFIPKYGLASLFEEPLTWPLSAKARHSFTKISWALVDKELDWQAKTNQHRITPQDNHYPPGLRRIDDPPPVLYLEGDKEALLTPQIAIVGTRHPSASGRQIARQFAYDLAKRGLTITSGLAYGIDAFAHQGALLAEGITLAVMGCGINHCYPKEHQALAKLIVEQGAIISELPPDAKPLAAHFPLRNRIITGLSLGVVVVEAALKSGSLISARLANEQGRLVMAIPGNIYHPQTAGCHSLIKRGAILVSTADDIFAELPNTLINSLKTKPDDAKSLDKPRQDMVQYLSLEARTVDDLVQLSKRSSAEVQAELTMLVLSGHARFDAGYYFIVNK